MTMCRKEYHDPQKREKANKKRAMQQEYLNKKIMDIENAVTKSEAIFVEEINNLIKNKGELQKIERRNQN